MKRLLTVTLFLVCMLMTTSCGKPAEETNALQTTDTSALSVGTEMDAEDPFFVEAPPQVWFFPADATFEAWDNPMPFVNPMGSESRYDEIQTEMESYYGYTYADYSGVIKDRTVYGDIWTLSVPFDENKTEAENAQFIEDIQYYVQSLDGTILGGMDESVVFTVMDDQKERWWTEAVLEGDHIRISIAREEEMQVGQTYVIRTEEYENQVVHFSSYNPGNVYQSALLTYDAGEVTLDMSTDTLFGAYQRSYRTFESFYEMLGTSFYLDDLMYDPGYTNWEVTWNDSEETKEIQITLQNIGAITEIKFGEPLGAIKVSSENVAGIEAFPVGDTHLNISHPEFSREDYFLDETPDGDFILFVPAGQWDVKLYPRGESLVSSYETLMVPVHSGEMTVVDVPFGISSAMKAEKESYADRGIKIGTVRADESSDEVNVQFTLLDAKTKDVLPDLDNMSLTENGTETEILEVGRVEIPPSIVLLLDSSGSMKGQMEATLAAASEFIKQLPDNVNIQMIDFDDVPKAMTGTTKSEALKNLANIRVGGDTALYEAIGQGLNLLEEKGRPTLIVFTDGENDYRYEGGLTLEETIERVKGADVPLYTIGFGQSPDEKTLKALAESSDGQYFSATDGTALSKVFNAINERLGSTFELTYQRPTTTSVGDVPVISFVIDTSGSMMTEDENYGCRIYNVKNLLHTFVMDLPDEIQMQLTEFGSETQVVQAVTTNKMQILRGIGRLYASGATDIIGSVEASYKTLKAIPSTQKVMVYITDEALGASENEEGFQDLLSDIKKDGIKVLWVGMGLEEETEDFTLAAELSGGDYVVTEDATVLRERFEALLQVIEETPKSTMSNLYLTVEKVTDTGARESYSTGTLAELPPVRSNGEVIVSEAIRYLGGGVLKQYDARTAAYISGESLAAEEVIITKKMTAGQSGSNTAAEIRVEDVLFAKRLAGIDPPSGYRFAALTLSIRNTMPAQEVTVYPDGSSHPASWLSSGGTGETQSVKIPYMIPDFSSHFSASYNAEGAYPASMATWLVEKPLAYPGNYSITVNPDEMQEGVLVFLVPDTPMSQLSLHFYDTNYGHIDVPIVGEMVYQATEIEALPKTATADLSDTFSIEVTGSVALAKVPGTAIEPGNGSFFNILTGNFTSNVQALLQINALERISLRLPTASGDFYIPLSTATRLLPAGFVNPRVIAPGSFNRVEWLFEVPKALEENQSEMVVELEGKDAVIPIDSGNLLQATPIGAFDMAWGSLTINGLGRVSTSIDGSDKNYIFADLTFHDKADAFSSSGLSDLFSVVTDAYFTTEEDSGTQMYTGGESSGSLSGFSFGNGETENQKNVSEDTERIILGITGESVIPDGESRRGILLFNAPEESEETWYLYSDAFEDKNANVLKLAVTNGTIDVALLAEKREITNQDETFESELGAAIERVVAQYSADHPENSEQLKNGVTSVGDDMMDKQDIPVPSFCLLGQQKIEAIHSVEAMIQAMKALRYVPGDNNFGVFGNRLSKEALMTQGFGTEQDYANMAMEILSRLGYQPKRKAVTLTDKGRDVLERWTGIEPIELSTLPAVSYVDEDNTTHILVIPFMEEIESVSRLVMLNRTQTVEQEPIPVQISISLFGDMTGESARAQMGDMSDALGGDTDGEAIRAEEVLFDGQVSLDDLSSDAIDIGFSESGGQLTAFLMTPEGEKWGETSVNLDEFDVDSIVLNFDLPWESGVSQAFRLTPDESPDEFFFTVGINTPDLSEEARLVLQREAEKVYAAAENPSELSTLRWYGRSLIAKMTAIQTQNETEILAAYNLIGGRVTKPRVTIVTQKSIRSGTKAEVQTSISLVRSLNEIHAGDRTAEQSFNSVSGLFASSVESQILGENGAGIEQIWANTPDETELILFEQIDEGTVKALMSAGLPKDIIDRFERSQKMILIPDHPAEINGEKRWAWYEVDPETYETISVIDTSEKGAFVESTVTATVKGAGQYALGAFKGVDTSLWSVAAFSLELDDYEAIMSEAKAFAMGIANNFGAKIGPLTGGIGGKLGVVKTFGPVKFSYDGSAKASQNVLTFKAGFMDGVQFYFDHAN